MRTLLVGINEYKLPGNDLRGCFVISAIKDKGFEQEPNFVYGPNTDISKFI